MKHAAWIYRGWLGSAILAIILSPPIIKPFNTVQSRVNECPEIVRTAFDTTQQLCDALGRNQVCYGHVQLNAQPYPNVAEFDFSQEGDLAKITDMRNLRGSPMNLTDGTWGVALMRLQGRLAQAAPEQNVTLVVFGDVGLQNRITMATHVDLVVSATANVNVRQQPSVATEVVARMKPGQTVTANGRLADNSWLRVELPDGSGYGWVYARLVQANGDLETLEAVDPGVTAYGPMQAFTLRSTVHDAACAEAPDSGILIQTPEGMAQVTLLINEVDVQIGSTVYFQAQPGGEMTVAVVEGSARVEALGQAQKAFAGSQISVPIDENLMPSAPPNPPQPYDLARMQVLPIRLLERPITVHAPLTLDEIAANTAAFVREEQAHYPPQPQQPQGQDTGGGGGGQPPTGPNPPDGSVATPFPVVTPEPLAEATATSDKVVICHKGKNTLTISVDALPAHLAHGDTIGPCP
jgi:hypothetical protein